jgi:hypothetical protein
MSRLSGLLGTAVLLSALLATTALAGSGSSGDPEIPNNIVRITTPREHAPSGERVVLESRSSKLEFVSNWTPVMRMILTWVRVTTR